MSNKYDPILDKYRQDDSGVTSVNGDVGPDVVIPVFTGATASTNGNSGLVPVPLSGEEDYYLAGDSTWKPLSTVNEYVGNYGEIYENGSTQSITLVNTGGAVPSALVDYTPWWSATSGEVSNVTFTSGVSASDPSTLTVQTDGVYLLNSSISIQTDTVNAEVFMQPSLNGAAIDRLLHTRHYQTTSHTGNVGIAALLRLSAGDEVGLYFASDNNGAVTITLDSVSLLLSYQGA
jgi:hypothetical protein